MNEILLDKTIQELQDIITIAVKNNKETCNNVPVELLRISRDYLELYKFDKKKHED